MVSNQEYIRRTNKAVREGRHNRPIKVIYTKTKPTACGRHGVSSHQPYKTHDRISIWKQLARNPEEKRKREQQISEQQGRPVHVITRDRALRHELWHVHDPYASEKKIRYELEKKPLPKELPLKRRIKKQYTCD